MSFSFSLRWSSSFSKRLWLCVWDRVSSQSHSWVSVQAERAGPAPNTAQHAPRHQVSMSSPHLDTFKGALHWFYRSKSWRAMLPSFKMSSLTVTFCHVALLISACGQKACITDWGANKRYKDIKYKITKVSKCIMESVGQDISSSAASDCPLWVTHL